MILGFISPFLDMVILLGAVQGFIFSVLLFSSAKRRPANRYLAWLLILVSVASLKLFAVQKGWFDLPGMSLVDALVPLIVVMPIGPLIYFYVKTSLYPNLRFSRKDRVHFYPVVIDLLPQLTALIFIVLVITQTIKNNSGPWGRFIDDCNVYSDIPRWISITIYVWLAAKAISSSRSALARTTDPRINSFKWLRQLILLFQIFQGIWLVYLIPYVIPKYTDIILGRFDWYPVYVPLAILIYWLGIKGYIVSASAKTPSNPPALQPGLIENTLQSLRKAMEKDKLYLNPALTVSLLADHTGIGQKQISAVLNQHLNKSFNEFINEYRIYAIRQRLMNGEAHRLTIAAVAYEGGFNSLPTFQRAFKTIIGQTPTEFLAEAQSKV
jgi:AraC-like DNA-binding protein